MGRGRAAGGAPRGLHSLSARACCCAACSLFGAEREVEEGKKREKEKKKEKGKKRKGEKIVKFSEI
jgi:hypothetical protein